VLGFVTFLVIAALFFGLPITLPSVRWAMPISPVTAGLIGFLVALLAVVAVSWVSTRVLRGRLVIVDQAPTGDEVLDAVVRQIERVGKEATIRAYLRSFGWRGVPRMRDALIAQLERKGLLTAPAPGPTIFGLVDRRQVRREHPDFQAIGASLRRLVVDHAAVEPQAVALSLLFAWNTYYWSIGSRVTWGIYPFFAREEYRQLRAFLRTLRRGDPAVAAQVGPDLYAALRAIAWNVRQLRQESSSSG
jgi:hypothetical protein